MVLFGSSFCHLIRQDLSSSVRHSELTTWVRAYTKDMLSWATKRTSNQHIAEDLVQETFLIAAEKYSSFRRESEPKTWLFGILNLKIAEFYRSKKRTHESHVDIDEFSDLFFSEDGKWKQSAAPTVWEDVDTHLFDDQLFVEIFEQCLGSLPNTWNQSLTAKFFSEKTTEQICQELGISITNYWQLIHRAKLKMRSCLEQQWFRKNR